MQTSTKKPMDASLQFCPNLACCARGKLEQGTIVVHDRQRERYRCTICKKTFTSRTGTMFEGLRKPTELIVMVMTLLAYGCPVQAIVKAFDLDERTIALWHDRAGRQCQRVHEDLINNADLTLSHVQADAHSRESQKAGDLDGPGHAGSHAVVVSWHCAANT